MRFSIILLAFFGLLSFTPHAFAGTLLSPGYVQQSYQTQVSGSNTGGSAQVSGSNTGTNGGLFDPLHSQGTPEIFLSNILKLVVRIGAIIVMLMLVWVGFKYVTARGNPTEIEKAHQMLLWTIIGALVLLGAQAIASGIQATVSSLGG